MVTVAVAGEVRVVIVRVEGHGPVGGVSVVMISVIVHWFGVFACLYVLIMWHRCAVAVSVYVSVGGPGP